MTRTRFGSTWWGQQWLQALTQIDYDNRLPRGRSYANNGSVVALKQEGGRISAKVQGSRLYTVRIEVPAFTPKQAATLLEAVAQDPALLAGLLNRQLDPALLALAERLGLSLFPRRWNDLQMQCSCPDWAVPCKHLAAVVYLLSRDIDGDPFKVFELRGLDLLAGLQTRGTLSRQAPPLQELPPLAALLEPRWPATAGTELDFSRLPPLLEPLVALLQAQPGFYAGADLRALLQRHLVQAAKRARRQLDAPAADPGDPFQAQDRPRVCLDAEGRARLEGLAAPLDLPTLAAALRTVSPARLADLQPEWAALQATVHLAWHLVAQGAVVPQLFTGARRHEARSRWLPALLDAEVRAQLQALAAMLPAGLLRFARNDDVEEPPAGAAQALALCSLFIGAALAPAEVPPPQDKMASLLFGSGQARFDGPGEASMAAAAQQWLQRLHGLLDAGGDLPLVLSLEDGGRAGYALSLGGAAQEPGRVLPLAELLSAAPWASARQGLLQQAAVLAEFHPPFNDYLRQAGRTPLPLAADDLPGFLSQTLPALRLLGLQVLLPKGLERLLRPRLSMRIAASTAAAAPGRLSLDEVLRFDWRVALGEQVLSKADFERLLAQGSGIVRFKGEYVLLDAAEVEALRRQLAKPPTLSGAALLRVALAEELAGAPVQLDAKAKALLERLREAAPLPPPAGLQAQLRPYQARGYAWLVRNTELGFGSLLADDMGLGKTLQLIAALLQLKAQGLLDAGALLVVPPTLLTNWQKELARFAPSLQVALFHGGKRSLPPERPDVLLSSYGVVRTAGALLRERPWSLVVVDEAQNIKNPAAAQTRALKALPARCTISLSGTPVENRLLDAWSLFDFANAGLLGSAGQFQTEFATPIEVHRDAAAATLWRRVTAPFLLRRLKSDKAIIADLPDKIEQNQYCSLSPAQVALYEAVLQEGLASLQGVSDSFERRGLVLQLITALKQVCNHPAQYGKAGARESALSGKGERLLELLDEAHAGGHKALVFTQFRESGELISEWLQQRQGQRPAFLHGGVRRAERDAMVERFQTDRTERVLVLSLKAGGTGLNLTAASQVLHFDLWWNPAVEAQATDRAYRIGQQRAVQVHRLITRDSFEERIDALMRDKRELADLTVSSGESWIGQLPEQQLRELLRLS
ncbi:MAG: DEAD/DEAH box helicase [Inhella sp.]